MTVSLYKHGYKTDYATKLRIYCTTPSLKLKELETNLESRNKLMFPFYLNEFSSKISVLL